MPKESTSAGNSLADFSFDNDSEDFFGIKGSGTPAESSTDQVIKEVKSSTPTNGKGPSKEVSNLGEVETEENDEEVTFFEEEKEDSKKAKSSKKAEAKQDEEDTTETEVETTTNTKPKSKAKLEEETEEDEEETADTKNSKEEETEDEPDDKFFTDLASELKEKGVFQNIELKKDEVITEERFFELQDQEIEARVAEAFEAFSEELDPDGKAFLRFKKAGGKTHDFLAAMMDTELGIEELDVEDESQRKKVIRHYLSTIEGADADEIEDRIKYWKEAGQDKEKAKKYFSIIQKNKESVKQELLDAQEAATTKKQEDSKKFNTELNQVAESTEKVGAFKFTAAEKKQLIANITKPTEKVGKNKYVPKFNTQLANILSGKTPEAKQKLLLLAKLVDNNFDVTDIAVDTQTDVVKRSKSKLQESKRNPKVKSTSTGSGKALTDYFE